jgi:phosphoribosylamine--glycine ligase
VIEGLNSTGDALVFLAGTKLADNKVLTDGGRVVAVTGVGTTLEEARLKAYNRIKTITWHDVYYRTDIALDLQVIENQKKKLN